MKKRAILTVTKDGSDSRATLTMGDNGQGVFSQTIEIYAYDNMAKLKARDVAEQLGWEIAE